MKKLIELSELKELLNYDEHTGIFTWKVSRSNCIKIGDIAGCVSKSRGYLCISINGVLYQAHRLAFLYGNGVEPTMGIDHINGIKTDNRLINLREASQAENCKNKGKSKKNTSGVIGVYWHKRDKRWTASIVVAGKYVNGGSFVEFSEAVNARKNLEVLYGFHKNHGRDK